MPSTTRRAFLQSPALLLQSKKPKGLHTPVELNPGESATVPLSRGKPARVELLELAEHRDALRGAVRQARVRVRVNGEEAWLVSGNYRLPVRAGGVQVDCPAMRGLERNSALSLWRLTAAVRLRLWPEDSPWIEPGTFQLPLRSRWLHTETQATNEPTFVNGGDCPSSASIYYHNDLDFGGAEGLEPVFAATGALVVSARNEVHPDYKNSPARPRLDALYLVDDRGWFYRYSHFQSVDPGIRPGMRVSMGQRLGLLGKEGGAGWSHLHFGIQSLQPSGQWATEDAWPFVWQACLAEQKPAAIAVARPHHLVRAGEEVELDGSLSWSAAGRIRRDEWTLSSGDRAEGPRVRCRYEKPGSYSEILKITDHAGNTSWDFAVVQVLDPGIVQAQNGKKPPFEAWPPTIHALYWPTMRVRAGQPVLFRVCTFRSREHEETWDFGDGSPPVKVRSVPTVDLILAAEKYGETRHAFQRPGDYIVRVVSKNARGKSPRRIFGFPSGLEGDAHVEWRRALRASPSQEEPQAALIPPVRILP